MLICPENTNSHRSHYTKSQLTSYITISYQRMEKPKNDGVNSKMDGGCFTYKDRRTNIWVRERTKLIDVIYTVRKMKWSWAGHINRLKDDRWTSRVTTWRPYDKKRRQGRPAKRWRDDLDKYWSDTIWQRTAQDRVIWRRHAEAFAQPRDTTAA